MHVLISGHCATPEDTVWDQSGEDYGAPISVSHGPKAIKLQTGPSLFSLILLRSYPCELHDLREMQQNLGKIGFDVLMRTKVPFVFLWNQDSGAYSTETVMTPRQQKFFKSSEIIQL